MLKRKKNNNKLDCYFSISVIMCFMMLTSCVPTTLNTTNPTKENPNKSYSEIIDIHKELFINQTSPSAEQLIQKSKTFIQENPKYYYIDRVYFVLGTTLVKDNQIQEGIDVFEELIHNYRVAPSVEPSMLSIGLAYDKLAQHAKANEYYNGLINKSKYRSCQYAASAILLLQTDNSKRNGSYDFISGVNKTTTIGDNEDFRIYVPPIPGMPGAPAPS